MFILKLFLLAEAIICIFFGVDLVFQKSLVGVFLTAAGFFSLLALSEGGKNEKKNRSE